MARVVKCIKLGQELEGLDRPPMPGEMGQRVFENVSKEGWRLFQEHFKMVINEYHLDLMDPKADVVFKQQVEDFFFKKGPVKSPEGFVPPTPK